MASTTRAYSAKKKHKMRILGRKGKSRANKHGTTPRRAAVFGDAPAPKKA